MEVKGEYMVVDVDSLKPNEWNPNVQTDFIFEREMTSIKDHGFIDPILVRTKNGVLEIVDGEHRYKAAKRHGIQQVSILNVGEITDEAAKKLTVIMNEVRGRPDSMKMSDLLANLMETVSLDALQASLPYTDTEIKSMIGEKKIDWDKIAEPTPRSPEENDETEWATLNLRLPLAVKEQFEDQLKRFKTILFPDDDPKVVSHVQPFEAMIQVIAQTPDDHIMGGS